MKEYLKNEIGYFMSGMFGVIFITLFFTYCNTSEESNSRTVDEIIEQNRQIRADTTDTTIVILK